jgi:hypothetical protein
VSARPDPIPATVTPAWVRERVAVIWDIADDPERAHSAEDRLHADVLDAIAAGRCDDPRGCAAAALATRGIEFPRWRS